MRYLLDSDALTAMLTPERDNHTIFLSHLNQLHPEDTFCLSILTIYEFEYNIAAQNDPAEKERAAIALQTLKEEMTLIPLGFEDAHIYGQLKQAYKQYTGMNKKALKKHNIDLALASVAIAGDMVLISGDGIYEHLATLNPALKHENWLDKVGTVIDWNAL